MKIETNKFRLNPTRTITFGDELGKLIISDTEMSFEGDVEESAKILFDYVVKMFNNNIENIRYEQREVCAKLCEKVHADYMNDRNNDGYDYPDGRDCADAIRAIDAI